jgi:hypothetical protein
MISAHWKEWELFRATLLLHFIPEHQETLTRLGALLGELSLRGDPPPLAGNSLEASLKAAAADLRYLSGFLETQGTQPTGSALTPGEILLAQKAADTSREVARLAREIERAMAPDGLAGEEPL